MAVKLTLDLDSYTWGDWYDIEDVSGLTPQQVTEAMKASKVSAKLMTAVIWIEQRRNNQYFSLQDARSLNPADIEYEKKPRPPQSGGASS